MTTVEFLNIIQPEHDRTSCSDKDIQNGFYIEDDGTVNKKYPPRCRRCAYLEVITREVNPEDEGVKHYFSNRW